MAAVTLTNLRQFAGGAGRWCLDRLNPLFVRHLRQELRNRTYFTVFILLLVISGLASLAFCAGLQEGRAVGDHLFGVLAAALSFALWVAQPLGAYRAMGQERDDDTWDLIDLTGMRPGAILRGKLANSLAQGLLFTSAMAPFMLMAYLLRGIDLFSIVFWIAFIQFGGICLAAAGAFWGCLGPNKASRAGLGGLFFLACLVAWGMSCVLWFEELQRGRPISQEFVRDPVEAWMAVVAGINGGVLVVYLAIAFGSALLTFRADNRSTGPRRAWVLTMVNGLAWFVFLYLFLFSHGSRDRYYLFASAAIGWMIASFLLSFFTIAEDFDLSPRQARWLREGGWRRRLVAWAFGPGAARGRLLTLALTASGWCLLFLPALILEPSTSRYVMKDLVMTQVVLFGLSGYFLFLFAVSDATLRRVAPFSTAWSRRVVCLAVLVFFAFVPMIAGWLLAEPELLAPLSPLAAVLDAADAVDHARLSDWSGMIGVIGYWWPVFIGINILGAGILLIQALRQWHPVIQRVQATEADRNPRSGG